jgi:RNA polymerase sigma-70 factor (ECF subfamily)
MCLKTAPEALESQAGPISSGRMLRLISSERGRDMKAATVGKEEALEARLAMDLDGNFERLVRDYQDRLYSFAHRLTKIREDAEEVTQDAFVRAYRALQKYPAERIRALALRAWLYRITLNVARNRMRGKRREFVSIGGHDDGASGLPAWEPEDASENRPDSRYERSQRRADLASLVAGLPPRFQAPLILRYVEGLPLEEVATILNQPVGTTKSNVHRAINALRSAISDSRRAVR